MKLNIITYLIQQFPGHIRTFINENYCHIICIYIYKYMDKNAKQIVRFKNLYFTSCYTLTKLNIK